MINKRIDKKCKLGYTNFKNEGYGNTFIFSLLVSNN